jgi:sec-independent protein translocase protein TatA
MIGNIGPLEIGIVFVIALIVFGPKRLPELGHSLGRGMREFKESVSGEKKNDEAKAIAATPASAAPAAERPAPEPAQHS